ncbi:hypothetical protein [Arthrobacter cryoconiti]|uniref:DUF4232 domain-containing protein n=1 Tax=Arthrobacter cryoconiti TaxID=748907 RepID=A0ABV8QYF1_9MICC|nr:hypothetical protein [Arthrobacter cryoconiti]MCC9067435.1 hypothetical protein [Arthrobacter cryoconiti]
MAKSPNNGRGKAGVGPARKPKVSKKVFRRRRILAAVLALLVVGAIVAAGIALTSALGGSGAKKAADAPPVSPTSASSTAPGPAAGAKPAQAGSSASAVCDEAGIKVSASMDKSDYGSGEEPVLSLQVTNTGQAPCDINVGTSQMQFAITSGDDSIFNSKDCEVDPTNLVKNLKSGASETANFTWKRNRSAAGCAPVSAKPGAGTYVFVATLGKWSSEKVVFRLN